MSALKERGCGGRKVIAPPGFSNLNRKIYISLMKNLKKSSNLNNETSRKTKAKNFP